MRSSRALLAPSSLALPSLAVLCLALGEAACKGKGSDASAPKPEPSAALASAAPAVAPSLLRDENQIPIPTGPVLAILRGQGVGPIRLGATVSTIERHMQAPCEVRTASSCIYIAHAVDFMLESGVTTEIRVHLFDRAASVPGRIYGVFNGRFPEGAQLGMYSQSVIELLGKPSKIVPAPPRGRHPTVEIHEYEGMRLEYDRIPNGNVVLAGIVITR